MVKDRYIVYSAGLSGFGMVDISTGNHLKRTPVGIDFRKPWESFKISDSGKIAAGMDFRNMWESFRVSEFGDIVEFKNARNDKTYRFSVLQKSLSEIDSYNHDVFVPLMNISNLRLEKSKRSFQLLINGHPVKLRPSEFPRSAAMDPLGRGVSIGTEWSLYLFRKDVPKSWHAVVPSGARAVNITSVRPKMR